jgi:uncharacterized protein
MTEDIQVTKKMLRELDKFLLENKALSLIELHGYLTAAISGPTLVVPSQWLPAVGISGIHFNSEEHAQNIIGKIMSFYNTICGQLLDKTYKPLISLDELEKFGDEEINNAVAKWARGYMLAVDDNKETWLTAKSMEAMNEFLTPIMALNVRDSFIQEEIKLNKLNMTSEDFRRKASAKIPEAARSIYAYWRKNKHSSAHTADTKFCGRNDPCPCGSGKKFKKCCLN